MTKFSEETGRSYGYIYLLGELRDPRAPRLPPVSFLLPGRVVLQGAHRAADSVLFWGLFWISGIANLNEILFGEGLLLITAAILVVWLSFFSAVRIGIRHVLPALATEIVIASAAFSNFKEKAWQTKAVLCLLVVWIAVSVGRYYPQMIPYMNEWAGDRRYTWKLLADSNLDWGQDEAIVISL